MLYPATKPRRARPGTTFAVTLVAIAALALLSVLPSLLRHGPASLQPRDLRALEDDNAKCRHVHRQQDQCAWVRRHCVDEDAGLFSYLDLYFCRLQHVKPLGFVIIAAWTALLFSTIGIAASDFFCVNLSTISNMLGISENMAGVTFLAFGNGSPDVFSTFAAIRSNSGSLAVGELIGAAGFITAVVSGSMALVRPFKVARKSFVRDVSFFAVSVAFSMIFCANGKLELWECAVMVAYYVFYVVVVVVWHWWLGQRRIRREKHATARGHYIDSGAVDELDFEAEEGLDDDETTPLRPGVSRHASLEDFIDLERANAEHDDVLDQLDEGTQRQQWLGEINSSMRITQTPIAERRNISGAIRPSLVGALEFQSTLNSIRRSRNIQSIPIHLRRYSDEPAFTLAQQQDRLNDAQSFVSDPESTVASRGTGNHTPDLHHSESEIDVASRGRARSAGAADLLRLPRNPARPQRALGDVDVHDGLTRRHESSSETDEPELLSPGRASRTPTISINAPDESESRPLSHGQSQVGDGSHLPSSNRLALPNPSYGVAVSRRESEADHPVLVRPKLRVTPPSSLPQSRGQSPHLSPFPALRESTTPVQSGPMLGPTALDFDEVAQPPDASSPRPFPWWPYGYFAPPQEISRTLLPTLYLWREKNVWGKLIGIVAAPSFFLLTITLPVVEPQAAEDAPSSSTPAPHTANVNRGKTSFSDSADAVTAIPGSSRRGSTAQVAVQTEQRHDHNSHAPPSPCIATPATEPVDEMPEHLHAAVISSTSWNRWLVIVQCFASPYMILLTFWANFYDADPSLLLRPSLFCLLGSSVALLLVVLTTTSSRPPRWHWLLCFIGFAVSIAWISTIANEVVGVLKTIGVIFDISDAILGLTIFAVGNSLGDLVADITVARLGFPVMALSACFGGPMLNILLGIGLSGLYMTISGAERRKHKHPDKELHFKPYHVEVSTTLLVSAAALLVTLLGLLVVVPLNGWKMDRKIGWGLILLWVVATAGNLGVELSGIGDLW